MFLIADIKTYNNCLYDSHRDVVLLMAYFDRGVFRNEASHIHLEDTAIR